MGFWGTLGKILVPAGAIAAAPFSGGTSLLGLAGLSGGAASAVGAGLGAAGSILGGASKNQQQERILQDDRQQRQDAAILDRYKYDETLPGSRLTTSMRAGRIANAEPVSINWGGVPGGTFNPQDAVNGKLPTFSGGYMTPLDPRVKRQAGSVLDQELQKQLSNEKSPAVTPLQKEGTGSKILGGMGLGASLLGGINGAMQSATAPPVPTIAPARTSNGFDPNDPETWQ